MDKKIIELFSLTNQMDREIGIEIEMEGANIGQKYTGWNSVADGSLRGESVEFVLRKPIKAKDVSKVLDRLQNDLTASGATLNPSDRCGVHVHINCQHMTVHELFKFCILYLVVEDLLVKWCGPLREGNLFCLRATDAEALISYLVEANMKESLTALVQKNIRYAAIKFTSLAKYGSLEFRALQTPKDFSIINTWVEMLMAVKRASEKYNELPAIIEDISRKGANAFLTSIFAENAKKLVCRDMEHILMEAARRIQDVAYAQAFKRKLQPGEPEIPEWYLEQEIQMQEWATTRGYQFVAYSPRAKQMWIQGQRDGQLVTTGYGLAGHIDDFTEEYLDQLDAIIVPLRIRREEQQAERLAQQRAAEAEWAAQQQRERERVVARNAQRAEARARQAAIDAGIAPVPPPRPPVPPARRRRIRAPGPIVGGGF